MTKETRKVIGKTIVFLMVIYLLLASSLYSSDKVDIKNHKESNPLILIAIDNSNSMTDDLEDLRRNWSTIVHTLCNDENNIKVGIITFTLGWDEMFTGSAENIPKDLMANIKYNNGSDLSKAIEGLLATKRKLSPQGENHTVACIISDFWQDSGTYPTKKVLSSLTEIDSVYLRIIGDAPNRFANLSQNSRQVSEQELSMVFQKMLDHPIDRSKNIVFPISTISILVALIIIATVNLISRYKRKRQRSIVTEKVDNDALPEKCTIQIESLIDGKHLIYLFDLNKGPVTVGVHGDIKINIFTSTSILLSKDVNNYISILNAGQTVFSVENKTIRPGKKVKSLKSGQIQIPYEEAGEKKKVELRLARI